MLVKLIYVGKRDPWIKQSAFCRQHHQIRRPQPSTIITYIMTYTNLPNVYLHFDIKYLYIFACLRFTVVPMLFLVRLYSVNAVTWEALELIKTKQWHGKEPQIKDIFQHITNKRENHDILFLSNMHVAALFAHKDKACLENVTRHFWYQN